MTYEEARNHFKDQLDIFVCGEHHEAMKVAIEALDLIKRQQAKIDELTDRNAWYANKVICDNIAEMNLILKGATDDR